jgi:hypothetical protein
MIFGAITLIGHIAQRIKQLSQALHDAAPTGHIAQRIKQLSQNNFLRQRVCSKQAERLLPQKNCFA